MRIQPLFRSALIALGCIGTHVHGGIEPVQSARDRAIRPDSSFRTAAAQPGESGGNSAARRNQSLAMPGMGNPAREKLAEANNSESGPLFEPEPARNTDTPLFEPETTRQPTDSRPGPQGPTRPDAGSAPPHSDMAASTEHNSSTGRSSFFDSLQTSFFGKAAVEYRIFPDVGLQPSMDYNGNFSASMEPQFKADWDNGKGQLAIVPFARWDEHDSKRSHYDLREFMISQDFARLGVRVGIGRVFWGVTESRHTVDIINQTDLVENPDGEQKLGQPMVNVNYATDFGTAQVFFLPYSRVRTYPGQYGRIRPPVPVEQNSPEYGSGASAHNPGFAVRWARKAGSLDFGLAHFHGTTREPVWRPRYDGSGTLVALTPVYDSIDQTSLDASWAQGSWLWKLEAFTRGGQGRRFLQLTGGFEYTLSGVFASGADLGLLLEYLFDGREKSNLTTAFEHDVFTGVRLGLNDPSDTQFLGGLVVDTSFGTVFLNVEASRRIGDSWKLNFEARSFINPGPSDRYAFAFRRESYLMLALEKYF